MVSVGCTYMTSDINGHTGIWNVDHTSILLPLQGEATTPHYPPFSVHQTWQVRVGNFKYWLCVQSLVSPHRVFLLRAPLERKERGNRAHAEGFAVVSQYSCVKRQCRTARLGRKASLAWTVVNRMGHRRNVTDVHRSYGASRTDGYMERRERCE